jgi:hypothetical protein
MHATASSYSPSTATAPPIATAALTAARTPWSRLPLAPSSLGAFLSTPARPRRERDTHLPPAVTCLCRDALCCHSHMGLPARLLYAVDPLPTPPPPAPNCARQGAAGAAGGRLASSARPWRGGGIAAPPAPRAAPQIPNVMSDPAWWWNAAPERPRVRPAGPPLAQAASQHCPQTLRMRVKTCQTARTNSTWAHQAGGGAPARKGGARPAGGRALCTLRLPPGRRPRRRGRA